jgi:hypothetical protein
MLLADVELKTIDGLLVELLTELEDDADPADPVHRRLFPDGYSGPTAGPAQQEEFRELTHNGLRDERVARAQACRTELIDPPTRRGQLAIELDPAGCDRWLRVLNDLRLAIGTRLEITEEDSADQRLDPSDPQTLPYVIYSWLSAIQDELVRIAMR